MRIEYCGICDRGKVRRVNQDAVFMEAQGDMALFAVADGMGGHLHGEVASNAIMAGMEECWKELAFGEFRGAYKLFGVSSLQSSAGEFAGMVSVLRRHLENANRAIMESCRKWEICGSTVAALLIHKRNYCILSSGDSRIYYFNGWACKQLTVDDVWENQPEVVRRYHPKQRKMHADYGKLVHALGISDTAAVSGKTDTLKGGDRFLLCSDGFYKMCNSREVRRILKEYRGNSNGEELLGQIKQIVYGNGAKDNVSVILVRISEMGR